MKKSIILMALALWGCQQESAPTPAVKPVKETNVNHAPQPPSPPKAGEKQQIRIVGEVRYLDLEGGFFAIYDKRGKAFFPLNLGKEFKRHGLVVEIDGILEPDVMTIQQHGTPVRVLQVRIVDDSNVGIDPRTI